MILLLINRYFLLMLHTVLKIEHSIRLQYALPEAREL